MGDLLYTSHEWNQELLYKTWEVINKIATEKYGLTYYKPRIEIVTSEQMIHYHTMHALPFLYSHWSFGKNYTATHQEYTHGQTGLAYETIINSDPMVCYIMENNSMTMQALVLAHAVVGHGSFFKNSELFKFWTYPESVLSYAKFAKSYVRKCELEYGADKVEQILDAAHALQWVSIDRYERTRTKRKEELEKLAIERKEYEEQMYNPIWRTLPPKKNRLLKALQKAGEDFQTSLDKTKFPWPFPEENILYFIEKNSPILDEWQREILRIVRYFGQYLYPQVQTKVMNEGWASFWHYTLMHDLYDEGYISAGNMMEFLESHTAVTSKRIDDEEASIGLNPYALGFRMFMKIKQACENPSERDKIELKGIAGKNWLEVFKDIVENYNDSSFLGQFLTTDILREFEMFSASVRNTTSEDGDPIKEIAIDEIQDSVRLSRMRKKLSDQYAFSTMFPTIEIVDYKYRGDRSLVLKHQPTNGMALEGKNVTECLKYIKKLWGPYPVRLETIDETGDPLIVTRSA